MNGKRFGWLALGALVLIAGLAGLPRLILRLAPETDPDWFPPPGRWHRLQTLPEPENAERGRLLSLPYTTTSGPAPDDSGVLRHDPERATPGLNLYVSAHAPEAIVVDMDGGFVHRWRYSYERAFPGRPAGPETDHWRRVALLPDGSLIALIQGGGLLRLDRNARLVWAVYGGFYNDLHVTPEGLIYALTKEARILPEIHPEKPVLEDAVWILDPEGRQLRRISLLEGFRRSAFAPLLDGMASAGDILHSNTVTPLDGAHSERSPVFAAGNLLVSLREVDLVGILDAESGRAVWARRGPWVRQHEPILLPAGTMLLFDNRGAEGGRSRVLELEPLSGEIVWSFADPGFSSPQGGSCQRLPTGNTLITSSEQSRAFEVTPDGTVVWEFVNPHRGGREMELVATLYELVRLDAAVTPELLGAP